MTSPPSRESTPDRESSEEAARVDDRITTRLEAPRHALTSSEGERTLTEPKLAATRRNARPAPDVPGATSELRRHPDLLDRPIATFSIGWFTIAGLVTLAFAFLLRFIQLDAYTLTQREAAWAYDAWSFYLGKPIPGGESLPLVGPLFLILEALIFFLFGVTDAIARALPALVGLGVIALIPGLRPFFSRSAIIGMMVLTAISPTLVFASRTVDPVILIAFFSLLAVVSTLRSGLRRDSRGWGWPAALGVAVGGMFASGPAGISAIIAVAVALLVAAMSKAGRNESRDRGVVREGLASIAGNRSSVLAVIGGFLTTMVLAFTRLLSDPRALEGILTTFSDWGRMMATQTSTTPTQFFLYAVLLYELLAVVFAIVAMTTSPQDGPDAGDSRSIRSTFFLAWFVAALLLHSLAAGRQPTDAALVALPLVLLGGVGLGHMAERIPWRSLATTHAGLVPVAVFGMLVGLIAAATLAARANDQVQYASGAPAWSIQIAFVLLVVVVPLGFLIGREFVSSQRARYVGWSSLLVLATILGIYTIRTATEMAYERADSGHELLAQRVPTDGVRAFVDQTLRLSRDLSLTEVSNVDNTGSFGISIAIDPALEWPYAWYFRDFPDVRVTTPAGWADADMVIAPSQEGMEEAGYIVQSRTWVNRLPTAYEDLNIGEIASVLGSPSRWYDGIRYLLYRDLPNTPAPEQVYVGYTFRLSNQMHPSQGPFGLFQGAAIGSGSALGQFDGPTGIALSNDGETVYVVDSRNQRIQRFASDGTFIGVWSAETDPRLGLAYSSDTNQGASDLIVSDDGLIYVADTWNHRILVLDAGGQIVRELGLSGQLTDIGNSVDPAPEPGLFFGPRSVAVADGEIYVTDTGNERVQVFSSDGTFLRAFGGYGTEPGKLLEPVGIAIGPDGNVWVADSGNSRLSVFTRDGAPVRQIPMASWETQGDLQNFLRFGPDGLLYATSPGAGVVEVVQGERVEPVVSTNEGADVQHPLGITVAADGSLLLTDPDQSIVVEVVPQVPESFSTPVGSPASVDPSATPRR